MAQQLATRPLGDTLGLEVAGVDLSAPIPDSVFDEVKQHFWRNPVLVFRDQDLDAHKVAAVGRRFGPLQLHVLVDYRHEEVPEVSWLTNVKKDGTLDALGYKRATTWHSDGTFEERPPAVAILHAREIPSKGGGTMFCNMIRAYDTLPDETRERIQGLTGRHLYAAGPGGGRDRAAQGITRRGACPRCIIRLCGRTRRAGARCSMSTPSTPSASWRSRGTKARNVAERTA